MAGRGDRIKAYSIAVEVFGRGVSFDPQTDPIVRIEAGHLRRALERYYLTAGHADPILITIPKGGYVPTFSLAIAARNSLWRTPCFRSLLRQSLNLRAGGWRHRCCCRATLAALVAAVSSSGDWHGGSPQCQLERAGNTARAGESFDDLTGTDAAAAIASGLKQEVVGHLSKFKDIVVVESVADASRYVGLATTICPSRKRQPVGRRLSASGPAAQPGGRLCSVGREL